MSAAVQLIHAPLGLLPAIERMAPQGGDLLEFVRRAPKLAGGEEASKFEAMTCCGRNCSPCSETWNKKMRC